MEYNLILFHFLNNFERAVIIHRQYMIGLDLSTLWFMSTVQLHDDGNKIGRNMLQRTKRISSILVSGVSLNIQHSC